METKNIGIKVSQPGAGCNDSNCPFHGQLRIRGRVFTGTVVSDRMARTVTVEWTEMKKLTKYERFEKRRIKLKAHNPACINAREGDMVKIGECRPLSKTKHFAVIENFGKMKGYGLLSEALAESKFKQKKKLEAEDARA
ncbi:30S ribosomal protein S17 [Candidatus Woesearchaeota archaeon]|nr:30S ribosomal protein S17 [Candidatus Woesearchaeota archaeon]